MGINAFILLPVSDEAIPEIDDVTKLTNLIKSYHDLFKEINKNPNNKLFYDETNFLLFITKFSELFSDKDGDKINQLKRWLRSILTKQARNIRDEKEQQKDVRYILWNLEPELKVDDAHVILAEIAERAFKDFKEKNVLLNLDDTLEADRTVFLVFKDAIYISALPQKFAHIPYVQDLSELKSWLDNHQVKVFDLSDENRFRRTSERYDGAPIFQEIKTGYYWYLDNFHKDHYEVFDAERKHFGVSDLEGGIDKTKKIKKRRI